MIPGNAATSTPPIPGKLLPCARKRRKKSACLKGHNNDMLRGGSKLAETVSNYPY